ncbi:trichoplein keratin filament-binding protein-like isoform X2 [Paramacrobiotus metropolitanus]|nr:trichoplein keratin filament-binding protein-like isoform X2 [Paramacrobiotus metropolitanus]
MRQRIEQQKDADMKIRRAELAALLYKEEVDYQTEIMEQLKNAGDDRVRELKERAEQLRQSRTRQQEQLVAEKLHEAWKKNCPELREAVTKQIDLETSKAWGDQIGIKQQNAEEEKRMESQMLENMRREIQLAEERDQEKRSIERSRMHDLTEVWQEQVDDLRTRESQLTALKQQERELLAQLGELARLEDQRKKLEESEQKKDFGANLMKQHAAFLRRRNRQVQDSLKLDRQILESVQHMEEEAVGRDQLKKEHERSVAAQMREAMEDRIRREKERESEIDRLDREEAKQYWEKREEEWAAEENARKGLVNEVIGDLKRQIRFKMDVNRQTQCQLESEREELTSQKKLAEMEQQRQLDDMTRAQSIRRHDLDAQMRELEEKQARDRQSATEEQAKRQMEQRSYDDFLSRETAKMGVGPNNRCQSASSYGSRPGSFRYHDNFR